MNAFLAALALLAQPSVHPWPVGPGPRYTPPARNPAVLAGRPLGALRCTTVRTGSFRVHVELFADRRVVVLPAGIGVAAPLARSGAAVTPRGCVYPVRTTSPDGIVRVERGTARTLGDLFRIWGRSLQRRRLVSFVSPAPVRAYVGGRRVAGPVASIRLVPGEQIVVELGPYLAPHPFFLFTGGDS